MRISSWESGGGVDGGATGLSSCWDRDCGGGGGCEGGSDGGGGGGEEGRGGSDKGSYSLRFFGGCSAEAMARETDTEFRGKVSCSLFDVTE